MEELIKQTDDLLAKVPMNGDKTTIGLALHFLLPIAAAHFPPLLLLSPFVEGLSLALTAFGLMHKAVKSLRKKE